MSRYESNQASILQEDCIAFNTASNPLKISVDLPSHDAELMHSVFESLPGGVVVLDGEGCVQAYNIASQALFDEIVLGEQWSDRVHRAFEPAFNNDGYVRLRNGRALTV